MFHLRRLRKELRAAEKKCRESDRKYIVSLEAVCKADQRYIEALEESVEFYKSQCEHYKNDISAIESEFHGRGCLHG